MVWVSSTPPTGLLSRRPSSSTSAGTSCSAATSSTAAGPTTAPTPAPTAAAPATAAYGPHAHQAAATASTTGLLSSTTAPPGACWPRWPAAGAAAAEAAAPVFRFFLRGDPRLATVRPRRGLQHLAAVLPRQLGLGLVDVGGVLLRQLPV